MLSELLNAALVCFFIFVQLVEVESRRPSWLFIYMNIYIMLYCFNIFSESGFKSLLVMFKVLLKRCFSIFKFSSNLVGQLRRKLVKMLVMFYCEQKCQICAGFQLLKCQECFVI